MSLSAGLMYPSGRNFPVTDWVNTDSGNLITEPDVNFSTGMSLPRAVPAISGTMVSTS